MTRRVRGAWNGDGRRNTEVVGFCWETNTPHVPAHKERVVERQIWLILLIDTSNWYTRKLVVMAGDWSSGFPATSRQCLRCRMCFHAFRHLIDWLIDLVSEWLVPCQRGARSRVIIWRRPRWLDVFEQHYAIFLWWLRSTSVLAGPLYNKLSTSWSNQYQLPAHASVGTFGRCLMTGCNTDGLSDYIASSGGSYHDVTYRDVTCACSIQP